MMFFILMSVRYDHHHLNHHQPFLTTAHFRRCQSPIILRNGCSLEDVDRRYSFALKSFLLLLHESLEHLCVFPVVYLFVRSLVLYRDPGSMNHPCSYDYFQSGSRYRLGINAEVVWTVESHKISKQVEALVIGGRWTH